MAVTLSYSQAVPETGEEPLDAAALMSMLVRSGFAVAGTRRHWEIFPRHLPPTLSDRAVVRLLNLCYGRSGNVFTVAARKV